MYIESFVPGIKAWVSIVLRQIEDREWVNALKRRMVLSPTSYMECRRKGQSSVICKSDQNNH